MGKYSDYNIIPIGYHCIISIILSELNLRKQSYPFDWVSKIDQIYDTNIIYNIQIITAFNNSKIDRYILLIDLLRPDFIKVGNSLREEHNNDDLIEEFILENIEHELIL